MTGDDAETLADRLTWKVFRREGVFRTEFHTDLNALVAAVRDEAARDAGRAHAAFALECAAEDFEVEQRAKARAEGALHPWSEAVTFLAARAAALRAAPPTEGTVPPELWDQEHAAYRAEQDSEGPPSC